MAENANIKLFLVRVVVMKGYRSGEYIEVLEWTDLPFKVLIKWKWYFEYRKALLKVKHPRLKVELHQYDYIPESLKGQKQTGTKFSR